MSNTGNGFVPKENISKNKQTPLSPPVIHCVPGCRSVILCVFVAVQHVAQLHFGP